MMVLFCAWPTFYSIMPCFRSFSQVTQLIWPGVRGGQAEGGVYCEVIDPD